MDRPDRRPDADPDGVRTHARAGGRGWAVGLLVLAVLAGVVGWRMSGSREAAGPPGEVGRDADRRDAATGAQSQGTGTEAGRLAHASPAGAGTGAAIAARAEGEDPTPDLSDYVLPGEAPTMNQVIDALHQRGIRTGLGAFNPPGTSPPLLGLEVPDGFELPQGYVRHHQATDDGQRIAPILMFHPDLGFIEVRGRRVAIPANRVVPPELAPPGMPLRQVRIPPPRDGGGP